MTNDIKESISKHWDENTCDFKKAQNFDELDKVMYEQYPFLPKLTHMDESTGKDILEVGVGSAYVPCRIIRLHKPKSYTLYDISPVTLEIASTHLKEHCAGFPFKIIEGDMENMSVIPDNSFDKVIAIGSIHHTNEPLKALKEISRVLRKDGEFIFMFYNKDSFRVKYSIPLTLKYSSSSKYMSIDEVVRKWDGETNPLGIALTKSEVKVACMKAGLTITNLKTYESSASFDKVPLPKVIKTWLKNRYGDSMYVYGIKREKQYSLWARIVRRVMIKYLKNRDKK